MIKTTAPSVVPKFDAEKAFQFLKAQTDFGPRTPNSSAHRRCLDYLSKTLNAYADSVSLQQFTHAGYNDEQLHLTNLFASFKPQLTKRILLIAHWDSRPWADQEKDPKKQKQPVPGANDGASGVAVLLELARIMKSSPPAIGVDILLTDGEDYGKSHDLEGFLLGAKHFAKTKNPLYTPQFGILLDMVGDKDLQFPMEKNSMSFAPSVLELVWSTADELHLSQFVRLPGEEIYDEHIPISQAGIPTIDIIDFQYPYWHTTEDTPDKCSGESLEAVGRVLTQIVYSKVNSL